MPMVVRDFIAPAVGATLLAVAPAMQDAADSVLSLPKDLRGIFEYGLGYLLVIVLLVPLMRWLMSTMTSQQRERDELLKSLVQSLMAATKSMEQAVSNYQKFHQADDASSRMIADKLERILRKLE